LTAPVRATLAELVGNGALPVKRRDQFAGHRYLNRLSDPLFILARVVNQREAVLERMTDFEKGEETLSEAALVRTSTFIDLFKKKDGPK
jgi:hypothetical protein